MLDATDEIFTAFRQSMKSTISFAKIDKIAKSKIEFLYRFRALYKGLVPKILRLGPGGAIMLLVNEYVFEMLCQRFP